MDSTHAILATLMSTTVKGIWLVHLRDHPLVDEDSLHARAQDDVEGACCFISLSDKERLLLYSRTKMFGIKNIATLLK